MQTGIVDNRVEWVDLEKGIGISLVVMAHFIPKYFTGIVSSNIFYSIYLFHMPLFFFLGGYVYKKETSNVTNLIYQTVQLIVPYIAYFLLVIPFLLLFNIIENVNFQTFSKYAWGGLNLMATLNTVLVPLWFLQALFFTRIIYNLIQTKVSKGIVKHTLIVLFLLYSYYTSIYLNELQLPFSLNMVPFTLVIFHIGFLYKKYEDKVNDKLFSALGLVAILAVSFNVNDTIDIYTNRYGIPIVTLACSCLAIIFIKNLALILCKVKMTNIVFKELGRASIVIMALHYPVFYIIKQYSSLNYTLMTFSVIGTCYIIFKGFSHFNITQFLFLGKSVSRNKIKTIIKK